MPPEINIKPYGSLLYYYLKAITENTLLHRVESRTWLMLCILYTVHMGFTGLHGLETLLPGQPGDLAKLLRPGGLEAGFIVPVPLRVVLARKDVEVGRV
jgi:hypothetical protein